MIWRFWETSLAIRHLDQCTGLQRNTPSEGDTAIAPGSNRWWASAGFAPPTGRRPAASRESRLRARWSRALAGAPDARAGLEDVAGVAEQLAQRERPRVAPGKQPRRGWTRFRANWPPNPPAPDHRVRHPGRANPAENVT